MSGLEHEDITGGSHEFSNEEIETLYTLITTASALPGPPLRALFTAYDVAKKKGEFRDEGERLLGFLLRMVEDGEDGARHGRSRAGKEVGLMERFQSVLRRMGIEIEVDDTEGLGLGMTGRVPALEDGQVPEAPPGERTRSLDNMLDGIADKVAGELPFRPRRPSGAASDTGLLDVRKTRRAISASGRASRARRTASDNTSYAPSRPRSASVASRGSLRIYRESDTGTQQFGDFDGDSEQTDSFDRSGIQIPGVNAPLPGLDADDQQDYASPQMLIPPSNTQIVRDAETFDYHRLLARARTHLDNWRNLAQDATAQRQQMEAGAASAYRGVLLRASLDSWRSALQAKHQAVETERFFARLETRAEKARNIFLLTKALTHWAKSAEDEVQRTSTARRHILRTRYFNAWRDITAVNELKIQHFVLAKFLSKWRNRTAAVLEKEDMAIALHEHNIVYKLYWQWFWSFANRRAPFLYKNRLARQVFGQWAEIVGILKERAAWAGEKRDNTLARKALERLGDRARRTREMEEQAVVFRSTAALTEGFVALHRRAKFAPSEERVKARIDARLLRSTFEGWRRDTRLARQAREVDRMRVLRNGFTDWNDRLRIKAVADRIDDRVQLECLYKWTLASRVSLFHRIHDHRLKQSIFSKWAAKSQRQELTLEQAEQRFSNFKRRQILRACLGKVEAGTIERRAQEYQALSMYEPKVKQRAMDTLVETHGHIQVLATWAERADFYVTTKHALQRWRVATEFARRNRRREIYTQVRRTVKMNLVRRAFAAWRGKAEMVMQQTQQAAELSSSRDVQNNASVLHHWSARTSTIRDLDTLAMTHHASTLLVSAMRVWISKFRSIQTMHEQASALRQESAEIAATSCLKKLGWRLWNVRRREQDAVALEQRNFERHVRLVVRFWADQARESRAARGHDQSFARNDEGEDDDNDSQDEPGDDAKGGIADIYTSSPEPPLLNHPGRETQRLESWTPFADPPSELDLSFSISPTRPSHLSQSYRPTPSHPPRPRTYPPPSTLRRPTPMANIEESPTPTAVDADAAPYTEAEARAKADADADADANIIASNPAEPLTQPTTLSFPAPPQTAKPAYLQTPSKRSIARLKRPTDPRLPPSALSPERHRHRQSITTTLDPRQSHISSLRQLGAATAPPAPAFRIPESGSGSAGGRGRGRGAARGGRTGGVTRFEDRMREGGYEGRGGSGSGSGGTRAGLGRSLGRTGRG